MNPTALNAFLAIATALMIVGTFNHMNHGTSLAIRLAVLLIFAGLLAQGFGVFMRQWDHYADTMIYGGIAAFIIANRRTPCGIPLRYVPRISIAISGGTIFYTSVMWGWA